MAKIPAGIIPAAQKNVSKLVFSQKKTHWKS